MIDDRERQYQEYLALRKKAAEEKEKARYERELEEYRALRASGRSGQRRFTGSDTGRDENITDEGGFDRYSGRSRSGQAAGNNGYTNGYSPEPGHARAGRSNRRRENPAGYSSRRAEQNVYDEHSGRDAEYNNGYSARHSSSAGDRCRRRSQVRRRSGRRIAGLTVLIFFIAALVFIGGAFAITKAILSNMGTADVDVDNIGINATVDDELSGYENIAILGIDSRDMEDDSDARSDSIIIASINKETNEIKMFSVYRDTMLDLEEHGLDKITHAYYYGKAEGALRTLNRNLDLNIKEVVVVNWRAVAEMVDAVGGIKIKISEAEMNEMNKYIGETADKTGLDDEDIEITETGKQMVNGVQAVTYARIRKDALTGDYRRNERMKIVVRKVFKKAKNPSLSMISKVAADVLPQIKTNMSSTDVMKRLIMLKKYEMTDSTTGWPYKVGEYVGTAWYGPPWTLHSNVVELHEKFFDQADYTPTDTVESISESISYTTGLY